MPWSQSSGDSWPAFPSLNALSLSVRRLWTSRCPSWVLPWADWGMTLTGLASLLYPASTWQGANASAPGVLLLLAVRSNLQLPPAARGRKQGPYLRGLISLLVSTLKLAGNKCVQEEPGAGLRFCLAAANVCICMLMQSMENLGVTAAAATSSVAPSGSSSSSGAGSQQADGAFTFLLWLVLLGRCCFDLGSCLTVLLGRPSAAAHSSSAFGRGTAGKVEAVLLLLEERLDSHAPQLTVLLGAPQLAAAGFNLQPVQEQLVTLQQVIRDTDAGLFTGTDAAEPADLAQGMVAFVQQLCAFGVAASSIPVPDFCNNPECGTVHGRSAAELVSGHSCKCGRCRVARYCSRDCQLSHWARHKHACKALAAAAAAANAPAGRG